ncbi:MAG: T9SS type A sorting domain-containing protein [Flavobacteriales bacterium]|nr:T9SS type A sorting domain-containing protein [Flavobacteriales bacterium]
MKSSTLLFAVLVSTIAIAQNNINIDSSLNLIGSRIMRQGHFADAMAVQENGKILLGINNSGWDSKTVLKRLNKNGSDDSLFAVNSELVFELLDKRNTIKHILIKDDIIYFAGSTSTNIGGTNTYPYIAALDTSGQFKITFGNNGIESLDQFSTIEGMVFDHKDQIVLTGRKSGTNKMYVMRIDRFSGAPDLSFDQNGHKVIYSYMTQENFIPKDIIIDHQDKIVIAGERWIFKINTIYQKNAFVLRLMDDGSIDTTFQSNNSNGMRSYNSDTLLFQDAFNIHQRKNGNYVITGSTLDNFSANYETDYHIFEIYNNGFENLSFGQSGWVIEDLGVPAENCFNSHLYENGSALLLGSHSTTDSAYIAMIMIDSTGNRDTAFAATGQYLSTFGEPGNLAKLIAVDSNEIVIGGWTRWCSAQSCGPYNVGVARYLFKQEIKEPSLSVMPLYETKYGIFPNPIKVGNSFSIKGSSKELEIYSLTGSSIPFESDGNRISSQFLTSGTYIIKLDQNTRPHKLVVIE